MSESLEIVLQGIPGDRESQAVVDPPPQAVSTGTPQSPAVAAAAATTTATTATSAGGSDCFWWQTILSIKLFDLKHCGGVWICLKSCPHSLKRDSTTYVVVHTGVAVLSELTSLVGSSQFEFSAHSEWKAHFIKMHKMQAGCGGVCF